MDFSFSKSSLIQSVNTGTYIWHKIFLGPQRYNFIVKYITFFWENLKAVDNGDRLGSGILTDSQEISPRVNSVSLGIFIVQEATLKIFLAVREFCRIL